MTYASADLTDRVKVFDQYGIRILTADDINAKLPRYPHDRAFPLSCTRQPGGTGRAEAEPPVTDVLEKARVFSGCVSRRENRALHPIARGMCHAPEREYVLGHSDSHHPG